jgi:capsular exopolysaccharide synthesis family protein
LQCYWILGYYAKLHSDFKKKAESRKKNRNSNVSETARDGDHMQNPLSRYAMIAKRWAWLIVLGIVICGGGTYIVSKLQRPVYQASAFMFLTMGTSNTSPFDSTSASLSAVPTFAQLLQPNGSINAQVLNSVVAQHPGLTLNELNAMLTVKPQSNTQIIELDVKDTDPRLAMQLANEVSSSFAQYVSMQLPATVHVVLAQLPTAPITLKSLPLAALGALTGLGLALALIVIFEWIDDRPRSPEEVQREMGLEILTIFPRLSRRVRRRHIEEIPVLAERNRALCSGLNALQARNKFKLLMVTSALPGEGASSVAANLAYCLAVSGKRVLLVDADLREPAIAQHFQLENSPGLAGALLETRARLEVNVNAQPTQVPNLSVVTAGVIPANAADMLLSPQTEQLFEYFRKAPFDYVVFDTPSILPVADTQILAMYIEATILVIDASKTPRKALERAKQVLNNSRTKIFGVVVNKSPWPEYGEVRHYYSRISQPEAGLLQEWQSEMSTHAQMNGSGGEPEDTVNTLTIRDLNQTRGE